MFAKMEISNLYNQYLQALIKIYDKGEATAITHLVFKEKGYFTKGRLPDKNIDLAREETDDLLGILDKLKACAGAICAGLHLVSQPEI